MKHRLLYISLAFLASIIALSSCKGAKLSVANEQMARGEYFDAAKTYQKVYNKLTKREDRTLRGEVAFKMGECYRRLNQSSRATSAYQNAIRYNYPDSMAIFYLAQAQHRDGKYPAAIKTYEAFLEKVPNHRQSLDGIRGCQLAKGYKEEGSRYIVKQAKQFNSLRADFCPMFLGAAFDQLYFTSST